ncbi:hypothetical protein PVK06_002066 [Gossypium arboreum]|uniref:Uncharacterized protein n=1 Tax=Gossypium arboreum TaxID=29729 RepID=A0ABR0R2V0_GOSAR|nr:hypothetical protein PVK06_002066 [Gossypium arboreum]
MLASVTNTLYKQLKSCDSGKAIFVKLEDMFGGQVALARQSVTTSLMNAQQKPNPLVIDHMINLMGYFAEVADNESNLDQNTEIEMVFKSLSKDFSSFRAVYNH